MTEKRLKVEKAKAARDAKKNGKDGKALGKAGKAKAPAKGGGEAQG